MKIVNRRAKANYKIVEEIEAGMVLRGAEVKSLREGRGSLVEAFGRIKDGEVFLFNFMIPAYSHAVSKGYDPLRARKLLLHKRQIRALEQKTSSKGMALVPIRCYTKGGKVKVLLGVGKGKKEFEKREAVKRRDVDREVERALKRRG